MNVTGQFSIDAINGDPEVDNVTRPGSGNWEKLGDAPDTFVAAQVFNAPISVTLSSPSIPLSNQNSDGQFVSCYGFTPPTGSLIYDSATGSGDCHNGVGTPIGPGFGPSPSQGTYTKLSVTLSTAWPSGGASGSPSTGPCFAFTCVATAPLSIVIVDKNFNPVFQQPCNVQIGSTSCAITTNTALSLTTGDIIGIKLYSASGNVALNQFAPSNGGPNITVTLMP